jgi:hypothetical protein
VCFFPHCIIPRSECGAGTAFGGLSVQLEPLRHTGETGKQSVDCRRLTDTLDRVVHGSAAAKEPSCAKPRQAGSGED